jgi:hypothetical protein
MFDAMNDLLYPMSADIYYSEQSQNDIGEVTKSWKKDRSIKCSAIKNNPTSRTPDYVNVSINLEYDLIVRFRTNEDIQISSDDQSYRITDILITNICDKFGNVMWKEDRENATIFEIRSIEPMIDISGLIIGYRIHSVRSDNQGML